MGDDVIITIMAHIAVWCERFGSWLEKHLDTFFDKLFEEENRLRRKRNGS